MKLMELAETMKVCPIDTGAMVNKAIDCYRDIEIEKEKQLTLRIQMREQDRVHIALIEANTKILELKLEDARYVRGELIKAVCDLIRKENTDEKSLEKCRYVLDWLTRTDPLNSAGIRLQALPGTPEQRW